MTTITEDYVSFETAKLLKEKGFNGLCNAYYDCFTTDNFHSGCEPTDFNSIDTRIRNIVSAPTHQMAMKWLRDVYKISVEITSTGYLIDNDVEWECDIKVGHRLYFKHITNEKSFESCVEAAIKYCLENLI